MRIRNFVLFLAIGCFLLSVPVGAQSPQVSSCSLQLPDFKTDGPNIFDDRQEQDLGDALAEMTESEMRIAQPAADDRLTKIGERLLASLPASGIQYRFRLYESGEFNAFTIGGGRVYISRKLLAAVRTEDDLAGVIAHEIGHNVAHQPAIEFTRYFRIRMGVTKVGDRADVFATLHRFFETPARDGEDESDSDSQRDEVVADRIGLYLLTRAGYSPESYASFFDQISLNKGKTGNWLTDTFGLTGEMALRYRSARKLVDALPSACREQKYTSEPAFQSWLKATIEERVQTAVSSNTGDKPVKLNPPLRPTLSRVRFSPDGQYVLAQDEKSISVAKKDGATSLFRIDAPDVDWANFTPDSSSIVFSDDKLRVERWSVPEGKRTLVKELVILDGCELSQLSQDGKTLTCIHITFQDYQIRIGIKLIDVDTGNTIFDKPKFREYRADYYFALLYGLRYSDFVTTANSPDGRYMFLASYDQKFAWDFLNGKQVEVGGKLKSLLQTRMSFIGPDQLYVVGEPKGNFNQVQVLSFPDGRVLNESKLGNQWIESVTKGPYLIAGDEKVNIVSVLDPLQAKYLVSSHLPAMDVYDKLLANESPSGGIELGELGDNALRQISLPLGPLPSPQSAAFSSDGRYLAVSVRSRSSVWDLSTGRGVVLSPPFRRAWFDSQNRLLAQFPKYMNQEPARRIYSLNPFASKELGAFDVNAWQLGPLEFRFQDIKKEKESKKDQDAEKGKDNKDQGDPMATVYNCCATLEVRDFETQKLLWSKDYPHEVPGIWGAEDNRLVLLWDIQAEAAKAELKSNPDLAHEAESLPIHKKGMLIETVNPETGAVVERVVISEGDFTKGWSDDRRASVSGAYVLAHGEHGNTSIFKLSDGAKVGEFFGDPVASNSSAGLIAAVNREEEILLVEEATGNEKARYELGSPVLIAHFVSGKDPKLLVLTADQVVHSLPLPRQAAAN